MRDALDVVTQFFAAIERHDLDTAMGMLADDVVYHNVPLPLMRGRKSVHRAFSLMMKVFRRFEVRMINTAVNGDVVLTERLDVVHLPGLVSELPVMGTLEVRDGKIVAWRDYFDILQMMRRTSLAA